MKKFIILLFLLAIGVAAAMPLHHITVSGKITAAGKPIADVAVTDGVSVVWTNAEGEYLIETLSDRKYIYYSCPSGYVSPTADGVPRFFEKINKEAKNQVINFTLTKSTLSQEEHAFIAWADPQVLDMDEFPLLEKVAADVKKTVGGYEVPVHAISLGDNVFDKLDYFAPYKKITASVGVPFYQVLGNHDMDYNERSNELSDDSYCDSFGPAYYSFNVGKIHYVVLKDVFYTGFSYRYIGYIDERQLAWLEQDISRLSKGQTLFVAVHIPTRYGDSERPRADEARSNSVLNNEALYKILEPYNTHILAGHSHTQWNTQIRANLLEHTHAAASAAWWQGDVGLDGTPMGYTVYEVAGDSVRWHFKGVDKGIDDQFKVYNQGDTIIANVFNYDPRWKVELVDNGKVVVELQRYWGKDPYAAQLYVPGTNKKHSWLGVGNTYHLFRIAKPTNYKQLTVVVTDRFGKKHTKQIK